jgi:hypothetical protein
MRCWDTIRARRSSAREGVHLSNMNSSTVPGSVTLPPHLATRSCSQCGEEVIFSTPSPADDPRLDVEVICLDCAMRW